MEGVKSEEGLPIEALTFNQVQCAGLLGIMALRPLSALLFRVGFTFDRLERLRWSSLGRSPLWQPNPCPNSNPKGNTIVFIAWNDV